jgi:hypothetical protein
MLRWPGRDPHGESDRKEEQLDALKKRIMEEVQAVGTACVNEMILHGRFVLRAPLFAD